MASFRSNYIFLTIFTFYGIITAFPETCPSNCNCQNKTVECVNKNLRHFPRSMDSVTNLNLGANAIEELEQDAFKELKELRELNLLNNNIAKLEPRVFTHLRNLSYLYLNSNELKILVRKTFYNLDNLKYLALAYNHIYKLDTRVFINLIHLEKLSLNDNNLSTLQSGVFEGLSALKTLYIQNNQINYISFDVFQGLIKLEILLLENNLLKTVPQNLVQYSVSLEKLTLSNNPLDCDTVEEFIKSVYKRKSFMTYEGPCWPSFPVIKQRLRDRTVEEGKNATFVCIVSGWPRPKVVWLHNSREIQVYRNKYIIDNQFLKIKNVDEYDIGEYKCKANNSLGEATDKAKLNVVIKVKPTIEKGPQNISVNVGGEATFVCAVSGKQQSQTVWLHDSEKIKTDLIKYVIDSTTLNIQNVDDKDAGEYECKVINRWGEASQKAYLSIVTEVIMSPKARITLKCNVKEKKNTELQLLWYKNGVEISSPLVNKNLQLVDKNRNLIIHSAGPHNVGIYKCVDNDHNILLKLFDVEIKEETKKEGPKIIEKPIDTDAFTETSVKMHCKVESQHIAIVEWKQNGSYIQNKKIRFNNSTGTITIHDVKFDDAGTYECKTFNEYGKDTASATLKVHSNNIIQQAVTKAEKDFKVSINRNLNNYFKNNPQKQELVRCAEIYDRAMQLIKEYTIAKSNYTEAEPFKFINFLTEDEFKEISLKSGCAEQKKQHTCIDICFHYYYNSINGSCNNIDHPMWGSSMAQYRRLLPPFYENGFSQPVGWDRDIKYNGHNIPSAYLVAEVVIKTSFFTDILQDILTNQMALLWGKWINYDVNYPVPSLTSYSWDGVDCKTTCDSTGLCYPIVKSNNSFDNGSNNCIEFTRSSALCSFNTPNEKFCLREQVNQQSSFIDASHIYGYDSQIAYGLLNTNEHTNGQLRMRYNSAGKKPLLALTRSIECNHNKSTQSCFATGDIRVTEQIGLIAMHTIWMREHNRIASVLKTLNPSWAGDKIFYEARKIVGAQIQFITYEHWLPYILGPEGYETLGNYVEYNSSVDPSLSNVFGTAAFRFNDALLDLIPSRYDEKFNLIPPDDNSHNSWRLIEGGDLDPFLRGLLITPRKTKKTGLTENFVLDLVATIIQRGRDHGLPSYTKWRKYCGMDDVNNFDELEFEITDEITRDKLGNLYKSVDNIDVWVGGLLEEPVVGGVVGQLFSCILLTQFKNLRDGDRFWYENPSTFKPEQLQQIKKTSLARVLCDNGNSIDNVVENTFKFSEKIDLISCQDLPSIDLQLWKDCIPSNFCTPSERQYDSKVDTDKKIEHLENQIRLLEEEVRKIKNSHI